MWGPSTTEEDGGGDTHVGRPRGARVLRHVCWVCRIASVGVAVVEVLWRGRELAGGASWCVVGVATQLLLVLCTSTWYN